MKLTLKIKLIPSKEQACIIDDTMKEYISLVNDVVEYVIAQAAVPKLTSASVKAKLPSVVKNQCIQDARSIYARAFRNNKKISVLKKPVAIWNNQNYEVGGNYIAMPFFINGKSKKIRIPAIVPEKIFECINSHKLGAMRITKKNEKYIAQIAYEEIEMRSSGKNIMGIDLGIKCPAVAVISDGTTKFYGNGRKNKYIRRYYATRRKTLNKAKKLNVIKNMQNKEQRWMNDQDHKISRAIVNDAIAHNVGIIKMEKLSGIRQSARKSRKNNCNIHNWSFYRLMQYIEYKAALAGIIVEYIDPAYTSQTCPRCGKRNHANDRTYQCCCGYTAHRDRVGAVNILVA